MSDLLRVYLDPAEVGLDGYPYRWHHTTLSKCGCSIVKPIKDQIRERDGDRCLRCGHPYLKGSEENSERSEWSPCDEKCTHSGPLRYGLPDGGWIEGQSSLNYGREGGYAIQAQWRILTVHHLNGIKHDCRWWNLVSLCQRCHLTIQGKVYMERPWTKPHSEWFKPFVAGFYAWKYLDLELSQDETLARLDELLDLELTQEALF